ncbi:MAG TPA: hypothetical protein VK279_01855 [Solirubrobacteraceae bacterium]|nr:hypothetical protein [Solirubrobacteraceae bacterium]
MVIGPESEQVRPASGEGFSDAVTVAFGDPAANVFGFARVGLTPSAGASGLAVLFADRRPVAAVAQGGQDAGAAPDWAGVEVAGVRVALEAPLERSSAAFAGEDAGFELALEAVSPPVEIAPALGLEGYEQLARVTGHATIGGARRRIDGLGQRSHAWGVADWERMALVRNVEAWLAPDDALGLFAVRPAGAESHDAEELSAYVIDPEGVHRPAEARLSTTYDEEGRQLRGGVELWGEEDLTHRLAGEAMCGSTLDLGRVRWDCAFFRWRMEGREGFGRYDVLRRADGA